MANSESLTRGACCFPLFMLQIACAPEEDKSSATASEQASTSVGTMGSEPTGSSTVGGASVGTTGSSNNCAVDCPQSKVLDGPIVVYGDDEAGMYTCVTEIKGDISFHGAGWSPAEFSALRRVSGTLTLASTACPPSFLGCLEHVRSLVVTRPHVCWSDFGSLAGLKGIEDRLVVEDSPGLVSLKGLENLTLAPTRVFLRRNPALNSATALLLAPDVALVELDGLPGLTELSLLSPVSKIGTLSLSGLPGVASLSGLEGLVSAGQLRIGRCPGDSGGDGLDSILSLDGLNNLASVDSLTIVANDELTSLAGAEMLSLINSVTIAGNPKLSQVEVEQFLAQNSNPNATVCTEIGCGCP